MEDVPTDLFESVRFYIGNDEDRQVGKLLRRGGAKPEFSPNERVTHIISTPGRILPSFIFENSVLQAETVKREWVIMSVKCRSLLPTDPFSLKSDRLFSGVVVCASQMSETDRHSVLAMVTFYGGRYQSQLNSKCTHLVTPVPRGAKYECAVKHRDSVKVVAPEWIIDCIKLGHCVDESNYDLSCPPSVEESTSGRVPTLREDGIQSCKSEGVGRTSTVIPLPSCITNDNDRVTISAQSVASDGSIVAQQNEIQTVSPLSAVCDKSNGEEIETVCQNDSLTQCESTESAGSADIGVNVREQKLANDTSQVETRRPQDCSDASVRLDVGILSKFETAAASVTGVGVVSDAAAKATAMNETEGVQEDGVGRSRSCTTSPNVILKDVVSKDNGELGSEVLDACGFLQGCCFVFVDYPELVGEETIRRWSQFIVDHGGAVLPQYETTQCTHLLACNRLGQVFARALADGKRIATLYWLSDKLMDKHLSPPVRPLHLPVPFSCEVAACRSMNISSSGFVESWERRHVKDMITTVGAQYSANMTRSNTHLICKRPAGEKYVKAMEWNIVIVNAHWLSDIVVGGVVPDPSQSRFTVSDDTATDLCLDTAVPIVQRILSCWGQTFSNTGAERTGTKRSGLEAELSPVTVSQKHRRERENQWSYCGVPAVMFTGMDLAEVKQLTTMVVELGGTLAESEMTCTHLVAREIRRTVKFLSVISVCRFVVRPEWLENSYEKRWFLDESDYPVCDPAKERQWQFSLERTLELAHQRPLLEGMSVYVTLSVVPSPSQMKTIVECAGGTVLTVPPASRGETLSNSCPSVIVVSCAADRLQCRPFFEAGIDVYGAEVILTGVLRQSLDLSSNRINPG